MSYPLHETLRELTSIFRMTGPYFMVGVQPDGRIRVDGGHSTPKGVAQAQEIHKSIAIIRPPEGTEFFMVKVEPIPEFKGKVNRSAIDQLNGLGGKRRKIIISAARDKEGK